MLPRQQMLANEIAALNTADLEARLTAVSDRLSEASRIKATSEESRIKKAIEMRPVLARLPGDGILFFGGLFSMLIDWYGALGAAWGLYWLLQDAIHALKLAGEYGEAAHGKHTAQKTINLAEEELTALRIEYERRLLPPPGPPMAPIPPKLKDPAFIPR